MLNPPVDSVRLGTGRSRNLLALTAPRLRRAVSRWSFIVVALAAVIAPATAAEPVALFNGKDLSGWTYYLWDNQAKAQDTTTPMSAVWSVADGVLLCQGRPMGYLMTTEQYQNYKLSVEWRWTEGVVRGNSGVLLHTTTPNGMGQWPKCFESQLSKGNAGELLALGTALAAPVDAPDVANRVKGNRLLKLIPDAEKPAGEWNKMEVLCQGDEITVWVNGKLVNHAAKISQSKGQISLQSEGTEVRFRNIQLTPLD
jgi:hypothetical protein